MKDEIERLIRADHFKEFVDEPQAVNRQERPQQWSPKKVHKVLTIIGGSYLVGKSHNVRDQYAKNAKALPLVRVQKTKERPTKQVWRELEDIVFTKAGARWVHHPHVDAMVIIARIANNNAHRLMVNDGSVVDILYLNAYKRMSLAESDLNPTTSPLYGFTGDHVIPKGTAKLTVMVGKRP